PPPFPTRRSSDLGTQGGWDNPKTRSAYQFSWWRFSFLLVDVASGRPYMAAILPIKLLLRLEALLLWMMFLLANLSIIPTTVGNRASAAFLSSSLRNFLIALRTVLC